MKKQKIIFTSVYAVIIFAFISLVCVLSDIEMSLGKFYSLYLGDFSIGFCSRFLIGEILSIFKDSFTREWITSFIQFSTFAIFLLAAFYIGNVLSGAEKTSKRTLLIFTLMFIIAPTSICIYTGIFFSFADIFLLAIFIIAAFFGNNKILIWTLPLVLASGVMVHDSYMFSYMCPCLGLVAYYAIKKYKKKIWASVVFVLSAISCVATSVYSVLFSTKTLKMTEQEMLEYLAKKGNCDISGINGYLETYLFFTDTKGESGHDHVDNIFEVLYYMIEHAWGKADGTHIVYSIAVLPLLILIFLVWIKCIKSSAGFLEKIPYILFMLTPVPQLLAGIIISTDYIRFFATIVITQIFYLFVCAKQRDTAIMPILENMNKKLQIFAIPVLLLFFVKMN